MPTNTDSYYSNDQSGNQTNGNWTDYGPPGTGAGWDNGLPGSGTDAGFSAAYNKTVYFNTTAEVHSLGGAGATLDIQSGSLQIDSGQTFPDANGVTHAVVDQGAINVSAGAVFTLAAGAGYYQVYGFSNAGTLTIGTGATLDTGSDTITTASTTTPGVIGGAIGGGGTLQLENATFAPTALTTSTLHIVGTVSLGTNLTYGGTVTAVGSNNMTLNGNTVQLTGSSNQLAFGVGGPGSFVVSGAATLSVAPTQTTSGTAFVTFIGPNSGMPTFEDAGSITQAWNVGLAGTATIDAGATYTIVQPPATAVVPSEAISDNGSLVFTNNGTLTDQFAGLTTLGGGQSMITNNAALTINGGATLEVFGTDTLAGTISGAGTLELAGNASLPGNISTGALELIGGTQTLGTGFTSYAGNVAFVGESLVNLSGQTVTLSGASNSFAAQGAFGGSGTVVVTGTANVNTFNLSGVTLEDRGSMTESGNLGITNNNSNVGQLSIDQGATYTITAPTTIGTGYAPGVYPVLNNGSLVLNDATGGSSSISGLDNENVATIEAGDTLTLNESSGNPIINDGTINVDNSTLIYHGDLGANSGRAGTTTLGTNATVNFGGVVAANQTIQATTGSDTIQLSGDEGVFSGNITGFAAGDVLDLLNDPSTIQSYDGQTLIIKDQYGNLESFSLTGPAANSLVAVSDKNGGTDIVVNNGSGSAAASPTITGTHVSTTMSDAPVALFSGVTVGDTNSGATDTLTVAIGGAGGTLAGAGAATNGVYTLSGSASDVTSQLDAVTFTPMAGAPGTSSTSTFTLTDTSSAYATPTTDGTTRVVDQVPAPLTINAPAADSTVSIVDPTISGTTSASGAGSTVTLTSGQTVLGSTVVASDGSWSDQVMLPSDGQYTIVATDVVNGQTAGSASDTFTLNSTPNESLFGSTTHDVTSAGGQIYALYETILGRAPDPTGFEGWVAALEGGTPLTTIAQDLLASPEYTADYGPYTQSADSSFVNQLYEDGLHRAAEPGGLQTWDTALADGVSRAQVAVDIATSQESQNDLGPTFQQGVFVPDASDSAVARLYYGLFDRAPDAAGLQGWEQFEQAGASLIQIATGLLTSPEYQTTVPGDALTQYVTGLYQNALDRAPSSSEANGWVSSFENGTNSLAAIADGILDSNEFQTDEAGKSNATYINDVYEAALGRSAEPGGLQGWENALSNGTSRVQVAQDIVGSQEFATNIAAPLEATFVNALYEGVFGQPAGASELQTAQSAFASGATPASVALGIAESSQAAVALAPKIEAGFHLA